MRKKNSKVDHKEMNDWEKQADEFSEFIDTHLDFMQSFNNPMQVLQRGHVFSNITLNAMNNLCGNENLIRKVLSKSSLNIEEGIEQLKVIRKLSSMVHDFFKSVYFGENADLPFASRENQGDDKST